MSDNYTNADVQRWFDELTAARKEITRLRAALEDMFAMLDEGLLVRDISNDTSANYVMNMLVFGRRLAACNQALEQKND